MKAEPGIQRSYPSGERVWIASGRCFYSAQLLVALPAKLIDVAQVNLASRRCPHTARVDIPKVPGLSEPSLDVAVPEY